MIDHHLGSHYITAIEEVESVPKAKYIPPKWQPRPQPDQEPAKEAEILWRAKDNPQLFHLSHHCNVCQERFGWEAHAKSKQMANLYIRNCSRCGKLVCTH